MDQDELKLLKVVELNCRDIIINLILHEESEKMLIDSPADIDEAHRNSYWSLVRNNGISMVILRWCHIFGNWDEKTHWRKIAKIDGSKFVDKILTECQIDSIDWKNIHSRVIDLRNLYLAHSDITKIAPNATKHSDILLKSTKVLRQEILNIYLCHVLNSTVRNSYINFAIHVSNDELISQARIMFEQGAKNYMNEEGVSC